MSDNHPSTSPQQNSSSGAGHWLRLIAGVIVLLGLYYPIGMLIVHKIDDDVAFVPRDASPERGSRAVAMAAALIDREVERNGWTANDPWFMPSSALDNMPNFQRGLMAALGRFAFELSDQIGRTRGSSQTDTDLQEAAGLLQYSGTKWIFDLSTSLMPTATSEAQYLKARRALLNYNQRLNDGKAVFERRADNLIATIDRIALDIGAASAALDRHIREDSGNVLDFEADDVFYTVKGQAYAYYLLLRELEGDFGSIVREKELGTAWGQMLDSFRAASEMRPLVVINGAPDAMLMPSHLASIGFYILRARTQMREISNILLK